MPISRRQFLINSSQQLASASMAGLVLFLYQQQSQALPSQALRPPGAVAEPDFLARCVRCGLCVRDCPYDILKLATLGENVTTGTPYFTARTGPCEMCEDIPCVKACPTNALDSELTDIEQARMGLAVLIDHEHCLNYLGLRCDVCYRVCPLIDQAITLDIQHNRRTQKHARFIPIVHSDHCTGCGKCEQGCVLDVSAIKVLPKKLAQGKPNPHYQAPWKQDFKGNPA